MEAVLAEYLPVKGKERIVFQDKDEFIRIVNLANINISTPDGGKTYIIRDPAQGVDITYTIGGLNNEIFSVSGTITSVIDGKTYSVNTITMEEFDKRSLHSYLKEKSGLYKNLYKSPNQPVNNTSGGRRRRTHHKKRKGNKSRKANKSRKNRK